VKPALRAPELAVSDLATATPPAAETATAETGGDPEAFAGLTPPSSAEEKHHNGRFSAVWYRSAQDEPSADSMIRLTALAG